MRKVSMAVTITIWSVIAILLTGVLVAGATGNLSIGNFNLFERAGDEVEIFSTTENVSDINSVDIKWHTGNVNITQSDDDTMRLSQTSRYEVEQIEYSLSGGKLTIKQKTQWYFIFSFGGQSSTLELSLPKKQYDDFIFKMTSGTSDINNVSAKSIKIDTTSGNLTLNSIDSEKMSVDITSGDIYGKGVKSDKLSVDTTSGKISLYGEFTEILSETTSGQVEIETSVVPQKLDSDITSGKITIAIPDNDGFELSYKKTSGNLDSDFDLKSSINNKDKKYSYGNGSASGREYSVDITSGTFKLNKIS